MKLSEFDFKDLDFQRMGAWPGPVKGVVSGFVVLVIFLIGWFWQIQPRRDELDGQRRKEAELIQTFSQKQAKVANLDELKKQVGEIKDLLNIMRGNLPTKTEMEQLLRDISQAALAAGLDSQKFEPSPTETVKEYYAERPINLRMVGTYDQFGTFASKVASIQRVVALGMREVSLKPAQPELKVQPFKGQLVLEGMAITYRYLDDEEIAQQQQNAQAAAPGTGGAP